jgi:aspartate racemase
VPKHVGIVGVSAEGAALCYRTLCVEGAELFGRHGHPEVTLHTYSLADYMRHIDAGDWPAVGELLLSSVAHLLRRAARSC